MFWPLRSLSEGSGVHRDSKSQKESSLRSVSLPSHTLLGPHLWDLFCFGHEPKARVATQSLHVQSLTQIKNVFTCSKHSNLKNGQSLFYFQLSFFLPNVQHSFLKMDKILTLMIKREKSLELMKICFITHFNTFGSKMFLTLKLWILKMWF
jgi:hypothetical protein